MFLQFALIWLWSSFEFLLFSISTPSSTQFYPVYCSQLFCQCIWWLEDEFQDFCFDLCSGDVMTFVLLMVGGWVTQSFRTSVMTFVLVDEMGKSDFLTLLKRVSWNFVKRKVHDRLTNRLKRWCIELYRHGCDLWKTWLNQNMWNMQKSIKDARGRAEVSGLELRVGRKSKGSGRWFADRQLNVLWM